MPRREIQEVIVRPGTLKRWHAMEYILRPKIMDGQVLLDVGGYDGFISYKLTEIFPNLKATVVDIDYSGLILAKRRGINVLHASADALPIRDNSVDIMICFDLIEHVVNDAGVIKEVSRVLKGNGIVFLTCGLKNRTIIPFKDMTKAEVIQLGFKLNVPFQYTWSCYGDFNHPCGVCSSCRARIIAFKSIGKIDPLK